MLFFSRSTWRLFLASPRTRRFYNGVPLLRFVVFRRGRNFQETKNTKMCVFLSFRGKEEAREGDVCVVVVGGDR